MRVTVCHLGACSPRKFMNFRRSENAFDAFSGHSWFSNDINEMTSFLMLIKYYTPSYTGADN